MYQALPALSYCKRLKAGRGTGNEANSSVHHIQTATALSGANECHQQCKRVSNQSNWLLISLAASPSLPSRSSGQATKPCTEGGEGLANIAFDCISTDQSDLTEAILSNFIHDSRGCKPSRSRAISPA